MHDAAHERGQRVVGLGRLRHDAAHHRHVARRQTAAERVGGEVLGEVLHEHARALHERRLQVGRARERRAVVERAGRIDRHAVVLDAPGAGDVEVLEREANRIDHPVARHARRVLAVLLHPLAHRAQAAALRLGRLVERRDVRGRRRRRRAEQHLHHPLAAQHRRRALGFRRERQDARVAEQAAAPGVGIRDPPHLGPDHARVAVVPGEPLVDVGVVGGEEVGDRAVVAQDLPEEHFGLAPHRRLQLLVEVGIEAHVGVDLVEILQPQPLPGETRAEHVRPGIGEHARDLLLELRRTRQAARFGHAHQLGIRARGPQEERQPRGEVDVAERVGLSGAVRERRLLEAEHEARAGQDALEGHAHPFFEPAVGQASLVERHQRVDVALTGAAAERLRRQRGDDAVRAPRLLRRAGRLAHEDLGAAGRGRHPGGRERTSDGHVAQMRQGGEAVGIGDARAGNRPLERRDEILHRAFEPPHEGGRHPVRPSGDGNRLGAQVDAVGVGAVHPPVDVEQRHARAVDRQLHLLGRLGGVQRGAAVAVERARGLVIERHAEAVLAVGRKGVHHREAAAGAVGRALDLFTLRGQPRHRVAGLARGGGAVTHRQPADLGRRGEIRLHRRRRHELRVGDVVEVGALGVERQIGPRVHVEAHEVAHGARILGAVQALEGAAPRGRLARRGIGARFEGVSQGLEHALGRAASARRRHLPGAHLADHLLGDVERIGRLRHLIAGQTQPAGLGAIVVAGHTRLLDHGLRLDRPCLLRSRRRSLRMRRHEPRRRVGHRGNDGASHQHGQGAERKGGHRGHVLGE